ncbi:helix-turn-helix domain-containing protein [Xylanimonas protaetiae]|uniref:Transcriptional regulator n=1 Tax=Xylanimonas protaetiae TaxID=2509457 RepID=A0A4P6F2B7_9MICO|nr:helix-turn-helix domain-containing protein [Xylanimonas protaetiae]QAY69970.1 transcriptional regulator [Xylanimonas protaetiae]
MTEPRALERDPMTGAALRCTRERLGLTTRWLADHLDVAERSVHRWESGEWPVPDGVRLAVELLTARHDVLVEALLADVDALPDPLLVTYRTDADADAIGTPDVAGYPAAWHRAAVGRVLAVRPGATVVYRVP